jgi:hypothetical protein
MMMMMNYSEGELYEIIDRSIDAAMRDGRFLFNMYSYLSQNGWTRTYVNKFIESQSAAQLNSLVLELDDYIKGGDKTIKEAYGHIPKPKARKIRDYFYKILEDAWRYHAERKPGRKPGSKNKKKVTK